MRALGAGAQVRTGAGRRRPLATVRTNSASLWEARKECLPNISGTAPEATNPWHLWAFHIILVVWRESFSRQVLCAPRGVWAVNPNWHSGW